MEAKLKALKVTDLKELLTKSGTAIPSKANKADLIAKILDTPDALKLVDGGGPDVEEVPKAVGDDDLLAPPDEFDWDGSVDASNAPAAPAAVEATATTEEAAPAEAAPAEPTTESAPTDPEASTTTTAEAPTTEDPELERRKARAARFGVPLVEPRAPRSKGKASGPVADGGKKGGDSGKIAEGGSSGGNKKKDEAPKSLKISAKEAAPNDDDAKLAARAARFGISNKTEDPAEDEKKKKREAKFGAPAAAKKAKTDA